MDKTQLLDMWTFQWPVMDVLIGGMSSIDLPELRLDSWDEATAFLKAYGFDPAHPTERRQLDATLIEALNFIESRLLQKGEWEAGIRPPDDILFCEDVRHLLLRASGKSPADRLGRAWACAVLRVMHTVAHIEGVHRAVDIDQAREQIFARFQKYLTRDEGGRLWLGDDTAQVELHKVEWKRAKSRQSVILKLLHKKDNVAEAIYDFIGIRLITKRRADVMLLINCLQKFNMVVFPNAYPSRARNNLLDLPRFKAQIRTLHDMLMAGSLSPEDFQSMVSRMAIPPPHPDGGRANPHSSQAYQSVQLTGRQLIKLNQAEFGWLEKLKKYQATASLSPVGHKVLDEWLNLAGGWHSVEEQLDVGVFFPFEVQILDETSYAEAENGDANHIRYKSSQVRAARKRVLSKVFELSRRQESP